MKKILFSMLFLLFIVSSAYAVPIYVDTNDNGGKDYIIYIDSIIKDMDNYRMVINTAIFAKDVDNITIILSTDGGDMDISLMIYQSLLMTKAHTKVIVSRAYSSGSIIMLSCKEIVITEGASVMVHLPSYSLYANIKKLRDKYSCFYYNLSKEAFINIYKKFLTKNELRKVLSGEDVYFTAGQVREKLNIKK